MDRRHRSSATPLAMVWAVLVLYASLYPFTDWRWPPGQGLATLALLPVTRWQGGLEMASNLLGYVPLGALLCIAARRSGWRLAPTLLLSVLGPAALSYGTEVLQQFLPRRVPALEDFALNTAGAAAGTLAALAGQGLGLIGRWQTVRERWFTRDSAGALALLALWPAGLLFPTPVPLGLGQIGEQLRDGLAAALQDVPWAATAHALLVTPGAAAPLRPLTEVLVIALGLLAPCLLAYSVVRPGWRRLAVAVGLALAGAGGMTLATGLNFSPVHALAWAGPTAMPGFGLGLLCAGVLLGVPTRLARGLTLIALTGLAVGVAQAPTDPYFAHTLQAWEQGRFVRFHGLAQWVGWLWPYVAMGWLLSTLATREPGDWR